MIVFVYSEFPQLQLCRRVSGGGKRASHPDLWPGSEGVWAAAEHLGKSGADRESLRPKNGNMQVKQHTQHTAVCLLASHLVFVTWFVSAASICLLIPYSYFMNNGLRLALADLNPSFLKYEYTISKQIITAHTNWSTKPFRIVKCGYLSVYILFNMIMIGKLVSPVHHHHHHYHRHRSHQHVFLFACFTEEKACNST